MKKNVVIRDSLKGDIILIKFDYKQLVVTVFYLFTVVVLAVYQITNLSLSEIHNCTVFFF
jgi:hypothetical protein